MDQPRPSNKQKFIFAASATTIALGGAAAFYFTVIAHSDPSPVAANPPPAAPATPPTTQPTPRPTEPSEIAPKSLIATNDPNAEPEAQASPPVAVDDSKSSPTIKFDASGSNLDDGILAPPREALISFLEARSWKERGNLVQLPETTLPEMEEYYATNQDGPVAASSITFQNSEPVPNKDTMFFLFHVATENVPEGFPVSVEETPEGYKIDWQAFVEFNDHHLFKFFTEFPSGPRRFHVIMRRAHYFGSSIPDLENKYAFRIEPPIPGFHDYAFVDKNSSLVESKLSYQLQWPAISYPIVELEWQESDGKRFIALKDLVQNNWRADDADASRTTASGG